VDPVVIIILVVVLLPVAVIWALAKSAALRGPAQRRMPRRPVETLVTEAVPEPRADTEDDELTDYHADDDSPADSSRPSPPSPPAGDSG